MAIVAKNNDLDGLYSEILGKEGQYVKVEVAVNIYIQKIFIVMVFKICFSFCRYCIYAKIKKQGSSVICRRRNIWQVRYMKLLINIFVANSLLIVIENNMYAQSTPIRNNQEV